jgi:hypothetical protein
LKSRERRDGSEEPRGLQWYGRYESRVWKGGHRGGIERVGAGDVCA